LRAALEIVNPKKVYLFGISPVSEKADAFLSRLAGLAKYVINQKGGKVTVGELAVVTGQREGTIRLGLEWLAAGGHISIQRDDETVLLSTGNGALNQYLQRELYLAVKGILEETEAYRLHFQRAEAESLIESDSK
jgi:DNA-binding transcriptional regulator PaaX